METPIISVRNLGKRYKLGALGAHSLRESLDIWWNTKIKKRSIEYYKDVYSGRYEEEDKRTQPEKILWALKNVSFEINEGDSIGIIGRNGAGKSTLLKILSHITEPTEGSIRYRGKIASLLEVGTGFHAELTGRENIYLNGAILGMSKAAIKKEFDSIVDFSEIPAFIDTPVKRYSSGMVVRLAFAVAAHLQADILVVDEVLSVGDSTYQKKCIDKMKERIASGCTVLFVSHQLATVNNLCERSILLDHGMKIADGPTADVIGKYLSSINISGATRAWDENSAPGTEYGRLRCVEVICKQVATDQIPIEQPVNIEVNYECLKMDTHLSCCIRLFDKLGTIAFTTMNHISTSEGPDPWSGKPFQQGRYKTTCTIPGNFLNEGYYSVHVLLVRDITKIMASVEDAVSFSVNDTGNMRAEYAGDWPGVVRPRFRWHTVKAN